MRNTDSVITVFVVDDEPLYADAHARMLPQYEVETAYSGEAALELVDETIDVLLIDRRMPALSGDDVVRALESQDVDCRTIFVSTVNPERDRVSVAVDGYLTKPVTKRQLGDYIDHVLGRRTRP